MFIGHPEKNALDVWTCNRINQKRFFRLKWFCNVLPGLIRHKKGVWVGAGAFSEDSSGRVIFGCPGRRF
jgi:hypothetical protein